MSAEFWTTIAQVSATLGSLVFVGHSIYLGNIYQATRDIGERLSEARPIQRSLMQLAVLSNLMNYWLPLVIALSFLLSLKLNGFPHWLPWIAVTHAAAPLLFTELAYRAKQTRSDWKAVRESPGKVVMKPDSHHHLRYSRRLRQMVSRRLIFGRIISCFTLCIAIPMIFVWRDTVLVPVFCILQLSCGAAFSLIDLAVFRAENVLYSNLEGLKLYLRGDSDKIVALMTEVRYQYQALKERGDASTAVWRRADEVYHVVEKQVPPGCLMVPMVEDFCFKLGEIATAAEIRGYSWSLMRLRLGIHELSRLLTDAQGNTIQSGAGEPSERFELSGAA